MQTDKTLFWSDISPKLPDVMLCLHPFHAAVHDVCQTPHDISMLQTQYRWSLPDIISFAYEYLVVCMISVRACLNSLRLVRLSACLYMLSGWRNMISVRPDMKYSFPTWYQSVAAWYQLNSDWYQFEICGGQWWLWGLIGTPHNKMKTAKALQMSLPLVLAISPKRLWYASFKQMFLPSFQVLVVSNERNRFCFAFYKADKVGVFPSQEQILNAVLPLLNTTHYGGAVHYQSGIQKKTWKNYYYKRTKKRMNKTPPDNEEGVKLRGCSLLLPTDQRNV